MIQLTLKMVQLTTKGLGDSGYMPQPTRDVRSSSFSSTSGLTCLGFAYNAQMAFLKV